MSTIFYTLLKKSDYLSIDIKIKKHFMIGYIG